MEQTQKMAALIVKKSAKVSPKVAKVTKELEMIARTQRVAKAARVQRVAKVARVQRVAKAARV